MRLKNGLKIAAFICVISTLVSCAKDREPRLIVNVLDDDGNPAAGATVHAFYGDDAGGPCCPPLNESEMNQTKYTDQTGEVFFDFPYSAVLDVEVTHYKSYPDPQG